MGGKPAEEIRAPFIAASGLHYGRTGFLLTCKGLCPVDPAERRQAVSATTKKAKSRSGTEKREKALLVTTRYSVVEYAALDEAASRAGLTRASYQRVQSLGTPPKTRSTRRAPIDREMLAKALGQLGRVGNNLNQLTHAANIDRTDRREIMLTMAELRGLLPLFMEALGHKP